jgi:hypothetical protein
MKGHGGTKGIKRGCREAGTKSSASGEKEKRRAGETGKEIVAAPPDFPAV